MECNTEDISTKFKNGEFTFTVIGLGRIGLPTASIIANKGAKVYGYDININATKRNFIAFLGFIKLSSHKNIVNNNLLSNTTQEIIIPYLNLSLTNELVSEQNHCSLLTSHLVCWSPSNYRL